MKRNGKRKREKEEVKEKTIKIFNKMMNITISRMLTQETEFYYNYYF